jgi:hypothetical protein
MSDNRSLRTFFRYMAIGFVVSSVKVSLSGVPLINIVETLFYTFMYNFVVGIWVGLAGMFGIDLYTYLKKNGSNEQYSWKHIVFCNSLVRGKPNGIS